MFKRLKNLVRISSYYYLKLFFPDIYAQDGLISFHGHDFMKDKNFMDAYNRGLKAGHSLTEKHWRFHFHWRLHGVLWAARNALRLEGDFVECGVNRGFVSSAIMTYLKWNTLDKSFFLFDTFEGLSEDQLLEEERSAGRLDLQKQYGDNYEEVVKNFSEFKDVNIIKGVVPASLPQADISKVCYLALDMNCAEPEIAAAHYFWDKLVPGAIVMLDDYAFEGYEPQRWAFNEFAREKNIEILALPTGQGMYIKP